MLIRYLIVKSDSFNNMFSAVSIDLYYNDVFQTKLSNIQTLNE